MGYFAGGEHAVVERGGNVVAEEGGGRPCHEESAAAQCAVLRRVVVAGEGYGLGVVALLLALHKAVRGHMQQCDACAAQLLEVVLGGLEPRAGAVCYAAGVEQRVDSLHLLLSARQRFQVEAHLGAAQVGHVAHGRGVLAGSGAGSPFVPGVAVDLVGHAAIELRLGRSGLLGDQRLAAYEFAGARETVHFILLAHQRVGLRVGGHVLDGQLVQGTRGGEVDAPHALPHVGPLAVEVSLARPYVGVI